MKRIIIICDGMADEPLVQLGGKTPLEQAVTPYMDDIASRGCTGLFNTVPRGYLPGSEVAILTILGISSLPDGRAALEASGLGVTMKSGQVAIRYRISQNFSALENLESAFPALSFHPISSISGIAVGTAAEADMALTSYPDIFWSKSLTLPVLERAAETNCAIIGAVPLMKGIASYIGAKWYSPAGATGDTDTDYSSKASAAISLLQNFDNVILHIEACDAASHRRDLSSKLKAIEDIDSCVIAPLYEALDQCKTLPFQISVISDHLSLVATGNHAAGKVPALVYYPGIQGDSTTRFSEKDAAYGSLQNLTDLISL